MLYSDSRGLSGNDHDGYPQCFQGKCGKIHGKSGTHLWSDDLSSRLCLS